jgi:hypothetical protein
LLGAASGAAAAARDDRGAVVGAAVAGGTFLERLLGIVDAVLERLEGRLVLDVGCACGVQLFGRRERGSAVGQIGTPERELGVGDVELAARQLRRVGRRMSSGSTAGAGAAPSAWRA